MGSAQGPSLASQWVPEGVSAAGRVRGRLAGRGGESSGFPPGALRPCWPAPLCPLSAPSQPFPRGALFRGLLPSQLPGLTRTETSCVTFAAAPQGLVDRGALCPCGVKGWVPDGPWGAPDGYGAGEDGIPETRPWLGSGVGSGHHGRVQVGPDLTLLSRNGCPSSGVPPEPPHSPPRHHPAPLWFEGTLEGGFLDGRSARRCISQS